MFGVMRDFEIIICQLLQKEYSIPINMLKCPVLTHNLAFRRATNLNTLRSIHSYPSQSIIMACRYFYNPLGGLMGLYGMAKNPRTSR
jgi:hypothetical protein